MFPAAGEGAAALLVAPAGFTLPRLSCSCHVRAALLSAASASFALASAAAVLASASAARRSAAAIVARATSAQYLQGQPQTWHFRNHLLRKKGSAAVYCRRCAHLEPSSAAAAASFSASSFASSSATFTASFFSSCVSPPPASNHHRMQRTGLSCKQCDGSARPEEVQRPENIS